MFKMHLRPLLECYYSNNQEVNKKGRAKVSLESKNNMGRNWGMFKMNRRGKDTAADKLVSIIASLSWKLIKKSKSKSALNWHILA